MDGRIKRMKLDIRIGTAAGLGVYFFAFSYLFAPEWTRTLVASLNTGSAILLAFSVLAGGLVLGNVHGWLDKRFFGGRALVDDFIRERITTPCRDALCQRAVSKGIIPQERAKLINLFYEFLPADDTQRELAFSYFTEYFITVNLSILSILGQIVAIIYAVLIPLVRFDQRLIFGSITLLSPAVTNGLRIRIRRLLTNPAEAQTTRIL